jgi:gamma-glutamyl phosphate reductase
VIFKGGGPAENTIRALHTIISDALAAGGVSKNACIVLPHRYSQMT